MNSLPGGRAHPAAALIETLDDGFRHGKGEMFRWMVSAGLERFGLPAYSRAPAEARPIVAQALDEYRHAVARSEPFADVLGDVYMQMVSRYGHKHLGQVFSPPSLAQLLAALCAPERMPLPPPPDEDNRRLYSAHDPACGAGAMLLAKMRRICEEQGPSALRHWSFSGVDLDPLCARIWALQALVNINVHRLQIGEVAAMHGDALGNPSEWKVVAHATRQDIRPDEAGDPRLSRRPMIQGDLFAAANEPAADATTPDTSPRATQPSQPPQASRPPSLAAGRRRAQP